MQVNILHGLAALLVVLTFFLKRQCVIRPDTKTSDLDLPTYSYGDYNVILEVGDEVPSRCGMMYTQFRSFLPDATFWARPKCKRDPDIAIDDEIISVHPVCYS